jgi:cytoskeleton protein RodZ
VSSKEFSDQEDLADVKKASDLLTEARQQLGLSQKEVGDKLFLAQSLIEHIDEGRYSSIPKKAFIRGYLRNYARIVGASGEKVVALYEAEMQSTEPLPEIRSAKEELGAAAITGPVLQTGFLGLTGVGLVAMMIWFLATDGEKDLPRLESVNAPRAPMQAVSDENLIGFVPREDEEKATLGQIAPVQHASQITEVDSLGMKTEIPKVIVTEKDRTVDTDIENLKSSNIQRPSEDIEEELGEVLSLAQKPKDQSAVRQASEEAHSIENKSRAKPEVFKKPELTTDGVRNVFTLKANGNDRLELSFKDDCWVEISDDQFGLIYNDLNRTDDVLVVEGTGPFKVLLGKATMVQMIYNNEPVQLDAYVRSDETAKISVPTTLQY